MKLLYLLLLIPFFGSCEMHTEFKLAGGKSDTASKATKIRNGIKLKSNGLHVSQAFLVYPDGSLVPEENLTKVNQYLKLILVIDKGWTVQNSKVQLGAAEKLTNSDGDVLLDEKDLFKGQDIVSATDAGIITLRISVTQVHKLYDYYQVDFKVWDKKSKAELSGWYRFNLD
jgi:hypothetical protein